MLQLQQGICDSPLSMESLIKSGSLSSNDKEFLQQFSNDANMNAVVKLCDILEGYLARRVAPVTPSALEDVVEAYDYLRCHPHAEGCHELVHLLRKPHMKALIQCHDDLANRTYGPRLSPVPHEVDEDDVSVKIVELVKQDEPLGATIKINERTGAILIARVMHGGLADRSDLLQAGDEVQAVNQVLVAGQDPMTAIRMLTTARGNVRLSVLPSERRSSSTAGGVGSVSSGGQQQVGVSPATVRVLFNYNPADDGLIPCQEAGLCLRLGDILQLLILLVTSLLNSSGSDQQQPPPQFFEELGRFYPGQPDGPTGSPVPPYRPLVLIGPSGVGRRELARQLVGTDREHFALPVLVSTRSQQRPEPFVSLTAAQIRALAEAGRLAEQWTEDGGNETWALPVDSLTKLLRDGRVPVCVPHGPPPHCLLGLRTPSLRAFVVYVKPPPLDVLRETRAPHLLQQQEDSLYDTGRQLTLSELEAMVIEGQRMESACAHLIDFTLVNDDLPVALETLSELAYRLETDFSYVPKHWL
uniref:MAGUK p55 subfamily member 7 n=1 Tax=Macrostomum lignano TaxID=282301 RepID=A0A1I8G0N8_9PLAT